ncbi:MAG: semialdehyde dehydrogenase, partial [Chloroflexi bacterium]|nr:semialdehyde dehydrogenase [Chloroflexota bacterium]
MTTTIALLGAGGKMGCRITDNMKDHSDYTMLYVEISEQGVANLAERGVSTTAQADALAAA